MRNRLQTRRDDFTVSWLELETYVDVNFDDPFENTQYSNLFNNLPFTPVPWVTLVVDSQIPLLDKGFTEINTSLNFKPMANLLTLGHRYLKNNPFFLNSSLFTLGGYYRIDDNWGFGFLEQYEADTKTLEQQRYSIYRDLTSWVASFGMVIRQQRRGKGIRRPAYFHAQGVSEIRIRSEFRSGRNEPGAAAAVIRIADCISAHLVVIR